MSKLCEELKKNYEANNKGIEIPYYIKENLNKELRGYQKKAFKYFLIQRKIPQTNHLMFNMATGSGKTVMMAALILECYQKGYRDFVFFVNSTSIVEKTKANFADKNSNKYLFKDSIAIGASNVEINIIENLDESKDDCINIYFTTIQSLFSLLKFERENALSLQDLEHKKIVFLADEAHHLNSSTKKINKKTEEEKEGWETIIKKAYESHPENLMLEFSATIPQNQDILNKYNDKIIYQYDLAKFCADGYSKRIFVMKYESPRLQDRFLGGILLSLFRELLAQDYGCSLKPVVLFKSEAIEASKKNEELFINFLENLDTDEIKSFYGNIDTKEGGLFKESLEFFKNKLGENFLQKVLEYLKNNFKKEFIINANNENEIEKNQILLNSLEDLDNDKRVIFAVDKLNEGWDVLNLFDIVRLGNSKSTAITTKEVQLIGRGARYCPFNSEKLNFDSELTYKRKFDNDLDNQLSMLERLSYHTTNEVEFIKNLNKGMLEQGILFEDPRRRIELIPNQTLKKSIEKDGTKIYYAKNRRIRKKDLKHFQITREEMEQKIRSLKIPFFSKNIQEVEEKFEAIEEEYNFSRLIKIGNEIKPKYFLKAMNILKLSFKELSENFNFESKNDFIKNYLGEINVYFSRKQVFNEENNLEIAKFILQNFKSIKETLKQKYEITNFEAHKLNMQNRVIFRAEEKVKEQNYDWLYYNKYSLDSNLEKEFLIFIEENKDTINKVFSQWFVIRNDGFEEFKLYDNRENAPTYAMGLEPDFVFFGKKINSDKNFLSIECFIEAKGRHLAGNKKFIGVDTWKEEFLETLKNQELNAGNSYCLTLFSLPFFKEKNDEDFIKAFDDFLEHRLLE